MKNIMKKIHEDINRAAKEIYEQSGVTIDKVFENYGTNKGEVINAMYITGLSIEELFVKIFEEGYTLDELDLNQR